uniref:Uncharacterized protein n=1 Tax=Amblyomma maculatum TaxID=34609 RepID=G3MT76_AMBMU
MSSRQKGTNRCIARTWQTRQPSTNGWKPTALKPTSLGTWKRFKRMEKDDGTANDVKTLEVEGVQAAEKGDVDRAIDIFSEVIRLAPNRASGYNNRAQALRMKGQVERALEDLNNAINLGHSSKHAASQAFCQRGLIYRLKGQDREAEADFKEAAKLGSQFAKNQLVQMNPYAALCNRMLGQMFAKLRQGEDDTR